MRVVYLAAGAAGTICGSCIRDNRLAATLIAQGRDVKLVPLYTPIRTDDVDVSERRVLFGGVNVYLQHKSPLFRRMPRLLHRLFDAPALLRAISRRAGNTRPAELGALTVDVLRGSAGSLGKSIRGLLDGLTHLKPDLINLPNLMFAGIAGELKRALPVPLVCTLGGEDSFIDRLPDSHRSEVHDLVRRSSGDIDGYVATSRYYADHCVRHFGLPADRVHDVPLGVNIEAPARANEPPARPFTIGHIGRTCPDKGLAELAAALVELCRQGRDCRLIAAGFLAPAEAAYIEQIRTTLGTAGVADRFDYRGEVTRDGKATLLAESHVFSMPSVFPEAKGLPVLEALAAGVPVVQPARGSFPELIECTGGGLLFDPERPGALAEGIATLMDDDALRAKLGRQGSDAVRTAFSDHAMAEQTWRIYERYAGRGA